MPSDVFFECDKFCPIPTSLYRHQPESQAPNGSGSVLYGGPCFVVAVPFVVRRSPDRALRMTVGLQIVSSRLCLNSHLKNLPKSAQKRCRPLVLPPDFGFVFQNEPTE